MLNFKKVSKVYFSPSGTTEKIVNEVAKNFDIPQKSYDLLSFDSEKTFSDELVIIGVPVFNGRIPKTACERLSKMKSNNSKAVVILNYGNMEYGDSLLELTELLGKNNFQIVGIATTVSQNSLFNQIAKNRPDNQDLVKINEFTQNLMKKLESGDLNEIFVSGYKPYQKYQIPKYFVSCDENQCVECMDCVYTCPEEAILEESPTMTNINDCSRCSTCINICSEGARSFTGPQFESERQYAMDNYMDRKEPEFYF